MVENARYAVVIGGVNLDIGGYSAAPLVARDSNPGKVRTSLGGVGRNIAHNMALLGLNVQFLTALGDDVYAQQVEASCQALGIGLAQALRVPGGATSVYLYIGGPEGDMELALSDMELYEHITPEYLQSRQTLLQNAQLLAVDANLPQESLEWLAEHIEVPIFADPVSTAKAAKLKGILGRLHTLKPNRIEAELLSGETITDEVSLARAAGRLLDTGLKRVFLSLGQDGVYAAERGGMIRLPCKPSKAVNATGAGDAFMAALAWAYLEGMDLTQTAQVALAAAAIAAEGAETINGAMSAAAVKARLAEA